MSRHSDRSSKNEVKSVCHPDERSDEACLPTVEHLQVGRDLAFRFFGRPLGLPQNDTRTSMTKLLQKIVYYAHK